jgi:hypothetical protein
MAIVLSVIIVALSVAAVVIAGFGAAIAVGAHRRSVRLVTPRPPHDDPRRAVARLADAGDGDRRPRNASQHALPDPRALRDMAIVRYDALQEMSGQLSFSLALLNAHGDGIVLTSINGRAEARTYAKAVVAGKSAQPLSPEEEEAVHAARQGQGPDSQAKVTEKPKITGETGSRSSAAFTSTG